MTFAVVVKVSVRFGIILSDVKRIKQCVWHSNRTKCSFVCYKFIFHNRQHKRAAVHIRLNLSTQNALESAFVRVCIANIDGCLSENKKELTVKRERKNDDDSDKQKMCVTHRNQFYARSVAASNTSLLSFALCLALMLFLSIARALHLVCYAACFTSSTHSLFPSSFFDSTKCKS